MTDEYLDKSPNASRVGKTEVMKDPRWRPYRLEASDVAERIMDRLAELEHA